MDPSLDRSNNDKYKSFIDRFVMLTSIRSSSKTPKSGLPTRANKSRVSLGLIENSTATSDIALLILRTLNHFAQPLTCSNNRSTRFVALLGTGDDRVVASAARVSTLPSLSRICIRQVAGSLTSSMYGCNVRAALIDWSLGDPSRPSKDTRNLLLP